MPTTTVRAADSAEAMDEVIARLGPDALILSTVKKNGMVEITATTDPVPPRLPKAERTKLEEPAEDAAESGADVPAPAPVVEPDVTPDSDKVVPIAAHRDKTAAEPAPKSEGKGKMASFGKLFSSRMNPSFEPAPVALSEGKAEARNPVDRVTLASPDDVLRADRLVIVGQIGAGKSVLALQLAAQEAQKGRDVQVSFVGASHADGAFLATKARILGCPIGHADLDSIRRAPRSGMLEIIVISGRAPLSEAAIDALVEQDNSRVVLVLPFGLRRRAIIGQAGTYRALDPVVALSRRAGDDLEAEDLTYLADAGLPLTWISATKSVVHALTAVERDWLAEQLPPEIPAQVRSLYAQEPSDGGQS